MDTNQKFNRIFAASVTLLLAGAFLTWGHPAHAGKKKISRAVAPESSTSNSEFESFISDLASPDPEKVILALQMLGVTGNPAASMKIEELLKTGPRSDVTNLAIETLGVLANPDALDTIIQYLDHRRSDVRSAAISALEAFSSPKVAHALEKKLRDSDPQVREKAAAALAAKGNPGSVAILFTAFERGVSSAARAIGRLGNNSDAIHLAEYVGKADLMILLPGFKEFLLGSNLDEGTKMQILTILFELAGPEVREFAVQMRTQIKESHPEMEYDDPVLKMLGKMINQIAQD